MSTLHFHTTGEGFKSLLVDFFRSGEFEKFETLLKYNLDAERMREAFLLRINLEGTTKDGGELDCSFQKESPANYGETLYFAIMTALPGTEFRDLRDSNTNKNISTLLKYLPLEDIKKLCWRHVLEHENYPLTTLYDAITGSDQAISGLLLATGEFVQCGYCQHSELYPLLRFLGLIEGHDRLDSNALSISSNLLAGTLGYSLQARSFNRQDNFCLTNAQVNELWKLREHNLKHYSGFSRRSVAAELLAYKVHQIGLGGKFGNLEFLKNFYPNLPLANYSKIPDPSWKATMIRTSPKKSLPGLLNSIKVTSLDEIEKGVEKIKEDFDKHKDSLSGNSINWFFQEFLEGDNGVVNCIEKLNGTYPKEFSQDYTTCLKYDVSIACSKRQGDVVGGFQGDVDMEPTSAAYLTGVITRLAEDFSSDIQLEFVITAGNRVKIVQMRLLENAPIKHFDTDPSQLENATVIGKTFSSPEHRTDIEVEVSKILIVEQDCHSDNLIGMEALIVENDTNFSHILALSKALSIPSIYGTGKVVLGNKPTYRFNTGRVTGYVK